jgi:beta-glucosidase-like glycosyl hydrolase
MSENDQFNLSPDIKFHLIRKMECHKVIGLGGAALLPHEQKYLEFHRLAGVILFERNIQSLTQLSELIDSVGEEISKGGVMPLVMADHEGDFVSELHELIGIPPSALAVAATGDTRLAREVAYETGVAMKKLGVNVVLAPVADVNLVPSSPITGLRTFGKDPERVAEFVCESIRGYREAGILTSAKHFPGHGSTADDSHESLPVVTKTLDELRSCDLVPFARAIRAGVDLIMMAHVAFPLGREGGDPVPASFDRYVIGDVLRAELGFDGAVITDALEMEGARAFARAKYGGLTGGLERALLAGSDLLLYSTPVPERMLGQGESEPMIALEVMQTIIQTLERVVDRGRIDHKLEEAAEKHDGIKNLLQILNESEQRIVRLREKVTELQPPAAKEPGEKVIRLQDYASTPAIYRTVGERSVILLRDPAAFLPIDRNQKCLLMPVEFNPAPSLKRQKLRSFFDVLCRNFSFWERTATVVGFEADSLGGVRPLFVTGDGTERPGEERGVQFKPPGGTVVIPVLSTRGVPPDDFLDGLSAFVDQQGVPMVIITGWPVFEWVPELVGALLTLGASPPVASALADVLTGKAKPVGSIEGLV